MFVYVAGQTAGHHAFNFAAFSAVAMAIRALGHDVWNPAERALAVGGTTEEPLAGFEFSAAAADDVETLCRADAVVLLPAVGNPYDVPEAILAHALGLPVWRFEHALRMLRR